MNKPSGDILRNATFAEIVGVWEVIAPPPPPDDPYGGSYFVIREDGVFGWVRRRKKLEHASSTLIREIIDAAGQGGDKSEQWMAFDFSKGEVIVKSEDGQEVHRHWFRTAVLSGQKSVFPAPLELDPGDIVWTEILPDPNKGSQDTPRATAPPDTGRPQEIAPPVRVEPAPTVELPPGYNPFLDDEPLSGTAGPTPPTPSLSWLLSPRDPPPMPKPPRLISPQPRREYKLRRLPEA